MLFRNRLGKGRSPLTDDQGRQIIVLEDASGTGASDSKITAATMPSGGQGLLGWLSAIWYQFSNPAVVTGNITAATAVPATIAGLTASSYLQIDGGTVDAVVARVSSIAGGAATATLAFYASDDDVNLYPLSGLPMGGGIGTGSLVASTTATGLWSLKGAAARKVYLIATAIGAGATVAASLSATPNQSRVASLLRGSLGGAISGLLGTPSSEALTVQGGAFRSIPTVTRPANQTPYTAGDVIGNGPTGVPNAVIEFASIGPAGGHIVVTSVDLMAYIASIPSGMTSFRLHLYDASPASALADNAAWDLPSGDRANYLGYVDVGTLVDVGSTLFVQTTQVNQQFKLAAGQTSLWGYLVTNGGFTPAANSEVYMPRLRAAAL